MNRRKLLDFAAKAGSVVLVAAAPTLLIAAADAPDRRVALRTSVHGSDHQQQRPIEPPSPHDPQPAMAVRYELTAAGFPR